MTSEVLRPRALRRGDLVAVAALSGALEAGDEAALARGVAGLEAMGFAVRVTAMVREQRQRWWSAGAPAEQADELNALLRDPEVRAVIAHTGGKSTLGYVDRIDLDAIRRDPKPILGYSDLSVLHLALHGRTGLVGLHADIATHGLGGDWHTLVGDARRRELTELYARVLTRPEAPGPLPAHATWECWRPGRARGRLVGGLLNRLVRLQATPLGMPLARFDGALLFWEEVGRPLSWVWNDLHVLRLAGVLDRIAGMVIGVPAELTDDDAGEPAPSLRDVVLDVVGDRGFPILANVDFGHASPNLPMPLGIVAELDAAARTLALVEPVVA